VSKTPYTDPDPPPRTPYGKRGRWSPFPAPKCPSCGSDNTVRPFGQAEPKDDKEACAWCLLDGCLGCLLWPLDALFFLFWLVVLLLIPKRRDCTCLDCGHHWNAIK
jgi:hypothetical protein